MSDDPRAIDIVITVHGFDSMKFRTELIALMRKYSISYVQAHWIVEYRENTE